MTTPGPSTSATTPIISSKTNRKENRSSVTRVTQKKLKFAGLQHTEVLEKCSDKDETIVIEDLDLEALRALVEEKRETLRLLERHKVEKQELIDLTEKWKEAGIQGLEEMRKIIKEPQTCEMLLNSFKIPYTVFFDDDL